MNAAVLEERGVQVAKGMASDQAWLKCTDDISMKVLSVDEARHSVEFLFKIAAGYESGRHKHTCETHVYVIQGKVLNQTTGCTFGPGDYCYQPYDDEHNEIFVEETIVYGSYRGDGDKLVEFYDENGEVCGEFKVSDFSAGLAA
jgi:quercetin dioxygenase-like cupin family protein